MTHPHKAVAKYALLAFFAVMVDIFAVASAADSSQWEMRFPLGVLDFRPNATAPWGVVCGLGFGANEAAAACRSMGRPALTPAQEGSIFGFSVPSDDTTVPIYMVNISCANMSMSLDDCMLEVNPNGYPNGTAGPANGCDYMNVAALSCPDGTRAPPPPPFTFIFYFRPTANYTTINDFLIVMKNNIVQYIDTVSTLAAVPTSRINVLAADRFDANDNMGRSEGNTIYNVTFQFTDPPSPVDPSKEALQLYIMEDPHLAFGTNLGFTSAVELTPPPTAGPPKVDAEGWQFILASGDKPWVGLLQVRTAPDASWGSVCDDGFGAAEANAACLSAGFLTTAAKVIYGYEVGRQSWIMMDDVKCVAGTGQSLKDCSFTYFTAQNWTKECAITEAVGIDCYFNTTAPPNAGVTNAPPATYSPIYHFTPYIAWSATVLKKNYANVGSFYALLGQMISAPLDRIHRLNDTSDDTYYYATFVFTQGTPSEPSRFAFDSELNGMSASSLDQLMAIQLLTNNMTQPVFTTSPDAPHSDGWDVIIDGGKDGVSASRGLVRVKPKKYSDEHYGTVCSKRLGPRAARALCNEAGITDFNYAAAVPFAVNGYGEIYLSDIMCDPGEDYLANCTYKVSYPHYMQNDCTHADDAGVLCGKLVGPEHSDEALQFNVTYVNTPWDANFFAFEFSKFVEFDVSRMTVTHVDESSNMTYVHFFFNDNKSPAGISRLDYEYILQSMGVTGALHFGMHELVSGRAPLPTVVTENTPSDWNTLSTDLTANTGAPTNTDDPNGTGGLTSASGQDPATQQTDATSATGTGTGPAVTNASTGSPGDNSTTVVVPPPPTNSTEGPNSTTVTTQESNSTDVSTSTGSVISPTGTQATPAVTTDLTTAAPPTSPPTPTTPEPPAPTPAPPGVTLPALPNTVTIRLVNLTRFTVLRDDLRRIVCGPQGTSCPGYSTGQDFISHNWEESRVFNVSCSTPASQYELIGLPWRVLDVVGITTITPAEGPLPPVEERGTRLLKVIAHSACPAGCTPARSNPGSRYPDFYHTSRILARFVGASPSSITLINSFNDGEPQLCRGSTCPQGEQQTFVVSVATVSLWAELPGIDWHAFAEDGKLDGLTTLPALRSFRFQADSSGMWWDMKVTAMDGTKEVSVPADDNLNRVELTMRYTGTGSPASGTGYMSFASFSGVVASELGVSAADLTLTKASADPQQDGSVLLAFTVSSGTLAVQSSLTNAAQDGNITAPGLTVTRAAPIANPPSPGAPPADDSDDMLAVIIGASAGGGVVLLLVVAVVVKKSKNTSDDGPSAGGKGEPLLNDFSTSQAATDVDGEPGVSMQVLAGDNSMRDQLYTADTADEVL